MSLKYGCIEEEQTETNGNFVWVHGTLFKMQESPDGLPTKWLGGQVAATAVATLERLTEHTRRLTSEKHLVIPVTLNGLRKWRADPISEVFGSRCLNDYVQFIDLRDDKGAYYDLHAHMFRRTFARHVARSDSTNLMALKEHFKHCSVVMTDGYVGMDEDLQLLLDLENDLLSADCFDKALRSTHLSGRRGKEIVELVDKAIADGTLPAEFRGEAGNHIRREMIRDFIEAGQQLYPCGARNFCWFRQDSADCTKGNRPIVEVCNPIGCANAVIEKEEHLPYWQGIENDAQRLLNLQPNNGPYRARLVSIQRTARKICDSLQ
jgi:hypothetical protein